MTLPAPAAPTLAARPAEAQGAAPPPSPATPPALPADPSPQATPPSGTGVETWSGKDRTQENFPVGVLVSPALRPHVHAFYSFARNADDIADNPTLPPAEKHARLDRMEAVLLGQAEDGSPSAARLRESLAQTGVTQVHSQELLRAFRQDADKQRYASWEELLEYCRYSAMPVGRHVLDLHGESQASWPASDALCAVLQVLNHLQDAARDLAALNRCYLPLDLLAAQSLSPDCLRAPAMPPGLRRAYDTLLDRCNALNGTGAALPAHVADRRLRLETAVIAGLSKRLARRLRTGDVLATRVKLRPADVAAAALLSLRHWRAAPSRGAPQPLTPQAETLHSGSPRP